jgi:dehydrogenase/reductase SDR family protein 7B
MFKDKVVWITGASSGIGEALAEELAKQGAILVLTARRAERLEALKQRMPQPSKVLILPGDLQDPNGIVPLAQKAEALVGKVDVLINNAGISQRSKALEASIEDVRRLMEINFFAPIALTNAVLPGMLKRGSGTIVILSSVAGYVGTPLRSSYSASKHAVRGYYDSLRAELDGTGVGVTIVCPGYINTEITEHALRPGGGEHGKRDKAIQNGLSAEKCAKAIANAIAKGKSEMTIGGPEVLAIYAKRFFPKLVERVVPKQAPS